LTKESNHLWLKHVINHWKYFLNEYNLSFESFRIKIHMWEFWAHKVILLFILAISRFPLGNLQILCHFDIVPTTIYKIYYLKNDDSNLGRDESCECVSLVICFYTILPSILHKLLFFFSLFNLISSSFQLCELIIAPSQTSTLSFFVRLKEHALGLHFIAKLKIYMFFTFETT
jgi:hypothetical protein